MITNMIMTNITFMVGCILLTLTTDMPRDKKVFRILEGIFALNLISGFVFTIVNIWS